MPLLICQESLHPSVQKPYCVYQLFLKFDLGPSEWLSRRGQGYNDDRDLEDWPLNLFLTVNSERWLFSVLSGFDGNWWPAVVEGA